MSRPVPAEDLLVLARQCKLDEDEERRFEVAMQSSRELECLYEAGLDFDREAGVISGDEKRLQRLVDGALQRIERGARDATRRAGGAAPSVPAAAPRRAVPAYRYFAVSMGLGMLLCVSLASAWSFVRQRIAEHQAQQAVHARAGRSGSAPRRVQSRPVPSAAPAPVASTAELALPEAASLPPTPNRAPASVSSHRRVVQEPASSSELFARANQARRKGDIEEAILLYERLAQIYPGSVEAEDAKILRGNLLLMQRSPRAALRQFEDYRAGALSLEALWGRAQALRKLQSPEERTVLLELLRAHPDSPYADAAKKRLGELAR